MYEPHFRSPNLKPQIFTFETLTAMPVKRSRIGTSSSFGETDVLSHVSSPIESAWEVRTGAPSAAVNPPKCLKPSLEEKTSDQPRSPWLLTMSSPVKDSRFDLSDHGDRMGGFLEKCYHCKMKICLNDEVFMYSDLRAFCTAACRDRQIMLDKEMEKLAARSKVVAQGQRVKNLKG